MKKKYTTGWILVVALACAVSILGQDTKTDKKEKKKKDQPNFSGTWVLDASRSYDIEKNIFKQAMPGADPNHKITHLLIIEHKDPEFKIVVKRRTESFDGSGKLVDTKEETLSELTFYTDKRGEKNNYPEDQNYPSTTTQSGREVRIIIAADKRFGRYNTLLYEMSKDGRELSLTNLGYKVQPDYTVPGARLSPSALRSTKYYIRSEK